MPLIVKSWSNKSWVVTARADGSWDIMPIRRPPLTQFHLFPKLPLEIQLMVWGAAEPEPRVVMQSKNSEKIKAKRHVPAVLHACRQSRLEYLADNKRKRSHATYTLVHMKLPTYFSFEIDTLYLLNDSEPLYPLLLKCKEIKLIKITARPV